MVVEGEFPGATAEPGSVYYYGTYCGRMLDVDTSDGFYTEPSAYGDGYGALGGFIMTRVSPGQNG
jgi:hypothetical protein